MSIGKSPFLSRNIAIVGGIQPTATQFPIVQSVKSHEIPLTFHINYSRILLHSLFPQGLVNVPFWGFVSHHQNKYLLEIFRDYIPKIWVMFNEDIYQPLFQHPCVEFATTPMDSPAQSCCPSTDSEQSSESSASDDRRPTDSKELRGDFNDF